MARVGPYLKKLIFRFVSEPEKRNRLICPETNYLFSAVVVEICLHSAGSSGKMSSTDRKQKNVTFGVGGVASTALNYFNRQRGRH